MKTHLLRKTLTVSFALVVTISVAHAMQRGTPVSIDECDAQLLDAASRGNVDDVLRLLDAGAHVNVVNEKDETPMRLAVMRGHVGVVAVLLKYGFEHGIAMHAATKEGWTPLHIAAMFGKAEVARLLLEHGADMYALDALVGKMPVDFARSGGCMDVVRLLERWVPGKTERSSSSVLAVESESSIGGMCSEEWTPALRDETQYERKEYELCDAIWRDKIDDFKKLLMVGVNLKGRDILGRTPLHCASSHGNTAFVSMLLVAGSDPNEVVLRSGSEAKVGWTPLHFAAMRGHYAVVKMLLEKGARVNAVNKYGGTPLHAAAMFGKAAVARLLLERGADVNIFNRYERTPLATARFYGRNDVVELLETWVSEKA